MVDRKKYTEKCFNLLHTDNLFNLSMIQQKRLKGKFNGPYAKLRITWLNKNAVGFTQQGHHLETLTVQPIDKNLKW